MIDGAFFAEHFGQLLVMAILLAASGFFSGTETALFSLTKGQLYRLRNSHGLGKMAAALMAEPNRTLNTLLLGNLLVNVAYAGISASLVLSLQSGPAWLALAAVVVPLLVLILLGEVTPKMVAHALGETWALPAAPAIAMIGRVLSVPLWVLERCLVGPMTRIVAPRSAGQTHIEADELALVLALSARRGIISHDANALLQEIVELTDLHVADVMVPRVDMIAYDVDAPRAGLVDLFARTRLRRIPVYEGDIDHITGLIDAKRLLLGGETALRELVGPVVFVPEAGNVERLLVQFRLRQVQTAIVVDEYGGTAGLVALQDVLEEIVGDIPAPGESAQAPAVRELAPRQYVLNADLAIHEWADAFRIDLAHRRISTIGGFVTAQLGRIARVGDEVTYRNLRFRVETMRRRRICTLRLDLLEEGE